ncbi:MAG: hypothetical protein RLZZ618_1897 [Pseudomonadota bacterium]|jgi:tetratricopeptide (TPR) repeat protein
MRHAVQVMGVLRLGALALCLLALTACATQTRTLVGHPPAGLLLQAELSDTPFFPQTDRLCGPAAAATVLGALGIHAEAAALGDDMFLPSRKGSLQAELVATLRRNGALATQVPGTLEAVLREVAAGRPVLVLQNLGYSWAPAWHYAVVVGYDLEAREVLLRSGTERRQRLSLRTFEHTWARSDFWALVATRPGHWPVTATASAALQAAVGFEREAAPHDALRVYDTARLRWPDDLSLAMGQGNTRFALGDKLGAAQVFEAAARQHQSAAAWINLAHTLLALGQASQAVLAAQDALALADPAWMAEASAVLAEASRSLGGRETGPR